MNQEEALQFLRQHQPLPADEVLTEGLIQQFDEVRRLLTREPSLEALPLLLRSLGEGDGFGVYQRVEDILRRLPASAVIRELNETLQSPVRSVRSWSAEFAASFPSPLLVEPLAKVLLTGDIDDKSSAITALEQIGSQTAVQILRDQLARETDSEVLELLEEALVSLSP